MIALNEAMEHSQALLWHLLLVFMRVGAVMAFAPGFGEQSLSVRTKLAAALIVSLALSPVIPSFDAQMWAMSDFLWFLSTEVSAGLILGLALRMFVLVLQTAGAIAAQATSLSQVLGVSAEPMPAMGAHFGHRRYCVGNDHGIAHQTPGFAHR